MAKLSLMFENKLMKEVPIGSRPVTIGRSPDNDLPVDNHAGTDDVSEVMFVDKDHKWIRHDKLVNDTGKLGVKGDQTKATPEMGEIFINYKIKYAVDQIRQLLK